MVVIEYGKEHPDVVILLHGGGLSWWNYREAAGILGTRYHVILPLLDGHAGSDAVFTDIEANAKRIIDYIDREHGGNVALIGGLSLGGQITAEILAQRSDICRFAILESALVMPMPLTHLLVKPMLDMSFPLIRQKWFSRLQFQSLKLKADLYEDYYRDTCRIRKADMTAFLSANSDYRAKDTLRQSKAKAFIFVGGKESYKMRRSADILHRMLPNSELTVMEGRYHGEFSANHAEEYAETVLEILRTP